MRRTVLVSLVLLAATAVGAWQAAPAQQPMFRAATELVQLDVSALDKNRKPVRDLTQADFTILEDGKPQPIVAFTPVNVPDAPPPLPDAQAWTQEVAPDVESNGVAPDGRLFVLFLDDAMMPPDPKMIADAKKAGRNIINHLGPNDQMAVVFSDNSRASQSFTSARAKLLAAVEQLQNGRAQGTMGWETAPNPSLVSPNVPTCASAALCPLPYAFGYLDLHPFNDPDVAAKQASIDTLRMIAEALNGTDRRRKTVVYVGPGVPVNEGADSPMAAAGTGRGMATREDDVRLSTEMPAIFRQMQRANVTVYTLDPSGLGGMESYLQGRMSQLPALTQWDKISSIDLSGNPIPGSVPRISDLSHFEAKLDIDFLENTAASTGGRAIINTNDLAPGIDEMFRENGSYYAIGYRATDPGTGRFHRISVKVDRPGVDVRARNSYYATDTKDVAKKAASPLVAAIAGVLPSSGLPLEAAVAPFLTQTAKGPMGTAVIVLNLNQFAPRTPMAVLVDLQTNAFTSDGLSRGSSAQHARVKLFAGGPEDVAEYEVLSHIDLKPGRYQLRLAAFNQSVEIGGSVFVDVDVPDFAGAPVSLSGVLLEAKPGLPVAPRDALTKIVPIVPTARRSFDARDQVSAFFNLYESQSGTPKAVTLTTRIVDEKGATIMDKKETVDADSFGAARTVDKHVELPLAGRAKGDYLLTIEATLGTTVTKRNVRFTVR